MIILNSQQLYANFESLSDDEWSVLSAKKQEFYEKVIRSMPKIDMWIGMIRYASPLKATLWSIKEIFYRFLIAAATIVGVLIKIGIASLLGHFL